MNRIYRSSFALALACVLYACGGTTIGGSGQIPSRLDVIATAPAHGSGLGIGQLTGLVGGKPAFISYIDVNHWSLQVVGESAVDLSTTAFTHSQIAWLDNGVVAGTYDGGTFVYRKTNSGWVATSFPGVTSPIPDGTTLTLVGDTVAGPVQIDLTSGTSTALTLPSGAALYGLRNHWLLYGSGVNFFVRNLATADERQLNPVVSDSEFFPIVLNSSGGVLGESNDGFTGRAIYWQPGSSNPTVLDSFPGGTVEPGWISPDGTKYFVNVITDQIRAYLYYDGTRYTTADIQNASTVGDLFGFDDSAQFGFARDTSGSEESTVAVKITYK
ncbi:MAG: hypothetical protein JST12_07130 [Armatimonadetes bacterium]|nr:hypothetical protein [Armatimonadota bacterium]